jgi:ubiquinone/menaquinone biosynthesis C-methylase UbiE
VETTEPSSESRDPLGGSDYVSIQHLERYRFARRHRPPDCRVLDVACGKGYGTMLLKQKCEEVIGADLDGRQVRANRERWDYEGFVNADARELPFPDARFDAVVSFETLEHMPDGAPFLTEVRRVLRPGGAFICSTPNRRYSGHPDYHLLEYTPRQFYGLIGRYFDRFERFAQYFRACDRLRDLLRKTPRKAAGAMAETLGIKNILKSLVPRPSWRRRTGAYPDTEAPTVETSILEGTGPEPSGSCYRVRRYDGEDLLRIMVALARKGA